ncbi:hypothetical protein AOQ84DRAFT_355276 [Glonium stellatum]|uniref:Uncharacterized protein n=1 Tax=Glonium stellatum TaxID=574774 RepID=A0A8E2EYH7_9PEZI|nr:hypothetical protein AOQ84DRAFT_355276 [Glonium stellatum]
MAVWRWIMMALVCWCLLVGAGWSQKKWLVAGHKKLLQAFLAARSMREIAMNQEIYIFRNRDL